MLVEKGLTDLSVFSASFYNPAKGYNRSHNQNSWEDDGQNDAKEARMIFLLLVGHRDWQKFLKFSNLLTSIHFDIKCCNHCDLIAFRQFVILDSMKSKAHEDKDQEVMETKWLVNE